MSCCCCSSWSLFGALSRPATSLSAVLHPLQVLRDVHKTHTTPVNDTTGIGADITATCATLLRQQCCAADLMVVLSADAGQTVVRRRKRRGSPTKPCLDYDANPHSAQLGELPCSVVLTAVPGKTGWHRARCNGHNCHRFGLPSPCELHVYNGPLVLADVSPVWLKEVHMGSRDRSCPSEVYAGMLIGPGRRDRFGLTAADRQVQANLDAAVAVVGKVAAGTPWISDDTDMEPEDTTAHVVVEDPGTLPNRHPYQRLHSVAKSLIAMADGNPVESKFVFDWLESGIEALRGRRAAAAVLQTGGSAQEAAVSTTGSTTCTKLGGSGGRTARRVGPG